ncbi:hypothetical protein CIG19_03075 [Enterobacterales bacterium CwR94]|nr:hypothetical protein CIG19_03075 [Enterobacterales bacterium CwR94]
MFDLHTLEALIKAQGLLLLIPLAIVEGPIVTLVAAWLARLGWLDITAVTVIVIVADLIGDLAFWYAGRRLISSEGALPRWLQWTRITPPRLHALAEQFATRGGRLLVLGKLTHSAGAAVLLAAGMARMPARRFLLYNTLATLPKSLFFVVLGYNFGHYAARINGWVTLCSLLLLLLVLTGGLLWIKAKKSP